MKKLAVGAMVAVMALGCAVPAFAASQPLTADRCPNYSEIRSSAAQDDLVSEPRSLNERLSDASDQAQASESSAKTADARTQADRQLTAPGGCARGACESAFVDADGDGICDNRAFVDADGDGICDNRSENRSNPNRGRTYVDADGDGICDNYGTGRQGNSDPGNGARAAHHGGAHHGASYR